MKCVILTHVESNSQLLYHLQSMSQATSKHSPEEVAEIEKHKYFLSEKVGHDVGWEAAEQDWESNHADQFRKNAKSATEESKGFFKRLLPRR